MTYLIALFAAFAIALIATPITILLAKKWGFVDDPNRKHPAIIHSLPIPRAGGLPTLIAIASVTLFLAPIDQRLVGILIGGFILVLVGVLDDKYDLNPYLRLFTNFLAALVVVGSGVGITWITNPLGGQIRFDQIVIPLNIFGTHNIVLLADIFALMWIVWVMNALSWSSGVDGQLSGIVVVATFIMGLVALRYLQTDPSQGQVAILSLATMGAYLGFLIFSLYPQKIMPGYGGATLAGFLLATLAILAGGKLATSLLVLAVPLVDAFFSIIRRLIKRRSPVWGDREHLHHLLLDLGWQKWQVALFYWVICAIFGSTALLLQSESKLFALILVSTGILAFLITVTLLAKRRNGTTQTTYN